MRRPTFLLSLLFLAGCAIPIVERDPRKPAMGAKYEGAAIQVSSEPSSAKVYLNGTYMGQTPTTIRSTVYQGFVESNSGLTSGKWYSYDRVVVEKEGYTTQAKEINSDTVYVKAGGFLMERVDSMSLHFKLEPEAQ